MPSIAFDATSRLARQFRPVSFAERGASLPFANRCLASSRIRRGDQGQLEVLVNGFAGGAGVYVVPVAHLGEVVALSLYDQALLAHVMRVGTPTPQNIRTQVLRVGLSGLGGPEIQAQAEIAGKQDKADWTAVRHSLLQCLAVATGVLDLEASVPDVHVGRLLQGVAGRLGISAVQCRANIERLTGLLYGAGCGSREPKGRLHRTLVRIHDFAESISVCGAGSDIRPIIDITDRTRLLGTDILEEIDRLLEDPAPLLAETDVGVALSRAVHRFAWLVDGWDDVCDAWQTAREGGQRTGLAGLERLLHTIPVLPRTELEPPPVPTIPSAVITSRAVASNPDWGAPVAPSPAAR